jgi:hypothetical protein
MLRLTDWTDDRSWQSAQNHRAYAALHDCRESWFLCASRPIDLSGSAEFLDKRAKTPFLKIKRR